MYLSTTVLYSIKSHGVNELMIMPRISKELNYISIPKRNAMHTAITTLEDVIDRTRTQYKSDRFSGVLQYMTLLYMDIVYIIFYIEIILPILLSVFDLAKKNGRFFL